MTAPELIKFGREKILQNPPHAFCQHDLENASRIAFQTDFIGSNYLGDG